MKLFDTSVVIEHIKRGVFEKGAISVITLIEILRGVAPEKRARVKELLEKVHSAVDISNSVIFPAQGEERGAIRRGLTHSSNSNSTQLYTSYKR